MKSSLGPEGSLGEMVSVLWEVMESPFWIYLELSLSVLVCGSHQEVSWVGQYISVLGLS